MSTRYTAFDGYPDNQWWVAAHSGEVTDKPLPRILLEEACVIYRPGPGQIAVLEDRCPHRQIPLSLGSLVDGSLRCNYHGLRFGADGHCVHAPGVARPTAALSVRSHPAIERHGYVWVWFGSAPADASRIPDYAWQVSPDWTGRIGYALIGCSYLLGMENVLDTSHFAYLHPNSVGSSGYADAPFDSWIEDDGTVVSKRRVEGLKPSGLFNRLTDAATVTLTDEMRWQAPSYLRLQTTVEAPGATFRMRGLAPYTPERRGAHHHWFAHFCDFPLSTEQQDVITRVAHEAIEEDRAVLEVNQSRIDDGTAHEPVMLPGDKAAILMRRRNREFLAQIGRYAPVRTGR